MTIKLEVDTTTAGTGPFSGDVRLSFMSDKNLEVAAIQLDIPGLPSATSANIFDIGGTLMHFENTATVEEGIKNALNTLRGILTDAFPQFIAAIDAELNKR
jgi:hypothetical protein